MMKWIQSSGKVIVDANTLRLECLLRIYNDDTSPLKDNANRYLGYVHLVSQLDLEAPYFKSDYTEVRGLAKRQLFGDANFAFPELLNNFLEFCIKEYQTAYEETAARAARVFRKKIDQLIKQVEGQDIEIIKTEHQGKTTFTSNFDILSKMMKDATVLFDTAEELEDRVKKSSEKDVKVRGGKRASLVTEGRFEKLRKRDDSNEQEGAQEVVPATQEETHRPGNNLPSIS